MKRRAILKATLAASALSIVAACSQTETGSDIVDIAASNGNFTTLVAAVQAAGLEDTLRSDGPFTVFAPTDAAFAALPPGTVDNLLLPENRDTLTSILTYHVVSGSVQSGDVLGTVQDVPTVNGQTVRVNGTGGKLGPAVRVNDANVTSADILASNGVIHVIDKVLLPR
jgi:uncharacterized surface protein with fasciclin (FAS1) repeats